MWTIEVAKWNEKLLNYEYTKRKRQNPNNLHAPVKYKITAFSVYPASKLITMWTERDK
jgi:hypothetical protein